MVLRTSVMRNSGVKNARIFITGVVYLLGLGLACPARALGWNGLGDNRLRPVNAYICTRTALPRRKFRGPKMGISRNSGELRTNRCGAP